MYIVTGGGSGIGRALALSLAAREQQVLVIGRRKQALDEVCCHSPLISSLSTDLSTNYGQDKMIDYLHHTSSLSGLIHCAGVLQPLTPILDLKPAEWRHSITLNLEAPLFLTQRLQNKLIHGRVLFITSNMAEEPTKGLAAYCVSKAALMMLIRCWRLDSLTKEMALTSVKPGVVETAMHQEVQNACYIDETLRQTLKEFKKKHRLLMPQTVALFLTWLLMDTTKELYTSKEWDIYDKSHHQYWLKPPHDVRL